MNPDDFKRYLKSYDETKELKDKKSEWYELLNNLDSDHDGINYRM